MSLLMLIASGGKRLVTEYLNSNTTWVCPATTFRIETLTGKAADGTPQVGSLANTGGGFTGLYQTSGSGPNSGYGTWDQLKAYADVAFASINSGGATNYTPATVVTYPNPSPTHAISSSGVVSISGRPIAGSAFYSYQGGASSSGIISSNGNIVINFEVGTGGTNGTSFIAFGQNFPGGSYGPAPTLQFTNIPVTPGNSYSLTIPSGCYIQFSYLR